MMKKFFATYWKWLAGISVALTIAAAFFGSYLSNLGTKGFYFVVSIPVLMAAIIMLRKKLLTRKYYIVHGWNSLQRELEIVITTSKEYLYNTGSRSRDAVYLKSIMDHLTSHPNLSYYRVMWDKPHHETFQKHLVDLISTRPPTARVNGNQKTHVAIVSNQRRLIERFICGNESRCVVIVPSYRSEHDYDTALVITDSNMIRGYFDTVKSCYSKGKELTSVDEITTLGHY